jgi:hypothetical protein
MKRYCAVAFLCIALCPAYASAGAWTLDKGAYQLIVTGRYYRTQTYFNNRGDKLSQANYYKREINPYLEYGLNSSLTLTANLSLESVSQQQESNWGLGDSEFTARKQLWRGKNAAISLAPLVKLPSPEGAAERPRIGSRHADVGAIASAGYGFSALGNQHYVNLDAGYRHRFGTPADQVTADFTAGIGLNRHLTLMPQLFLTRRMDKPTTPTFTQSAGDDYNLAKVQLSGLWRFSERTAVQLGGFSHATGRNAGAGEGGFIALWRTF